MKHVEIWQMGRGMGEEYGRKGKSLIFILFKVRHISAAFGVVEDFIFSQIFLNLKMAF